MNYNEFWAAVRPRIAKGTKISEIQRLYFNHILSYEDLINLPVLDAKEIRARHKAELERQEQAKRERAAKVWEEVSKTRILDKAPGGFLGVGVSPAGVLVSVLIDGKETPFTDIGNGWDPVKLIGEVATRDPEFFAYLKGRYNWDRLFYAVERALLNKEYYNRINRIK